MSYQHISTKTVKKARKEHDCDSCFHLQEYMNEAPNLLDKMTKEERLIVQSRKENRFKILKGESYFISVGSYDGAMQNVKYLAEIHEICTKYDLYPEWD